MNAAKQTAETVEGVFDGESTPSKAKPSKREDKKGPIADVVDDPDPTKKELEKYRLSQPITTDIVAKGSADELIVEANVPFDRLHLQAGPGASISSSCSI